MACNIDFSQPTFSCHSSKKNNNLHIHNNGEVRIHNIIERYLQQNSRANGTAMKNKDVHIAKILDYYAKSTASITYSCYVLSQPKNAILWLFSLVSPFANKYTKIDNKIDYKIHTKWSTSTIIMYSHPNTSIFK